MATENNFIDPGWGKICLLSDMEALTKKKPCEWKFRQQSEGKVRKRGRHVNVRWPRHREKNQVSLPCEGQVALPHILKLF